MDETRPKMEVTSQNGPRSMSSFSSGRRPKGRLGGPSSAKAGYRRDDLVFSRVGGDTRGVSDEPLEDGSPSSSAKRQQHRPANKNQSRNRQRWSGAAERNWRQREEFPDATSSSSHKQAEDTKMEAVSNESQTLPDGKPSTIALCSTLNIQAEPFVPKIVKKPDMMQNMAKLGKVKKQRNRQFKPRPEANSAVDGEESTLRTAEHQGSLTASNRSRMQKHNNYQSTEGKRENTFDSRGNRDTGSAERVRDVEETERPKINSRTKNNDFGVQKEGSNDRYRFNQRQHEHRQRENNVKGDQYDKTAQHPQRRDDSSSSRSAEKAIGAVRQKENSKRMAAQHAYLHAFSERKPTNAVNVETHRESLIEDLLNASYECTICYGSVGQEHAVWHCGKCYHIFHLHCLRRWGQTLIDQNPDHRVWRCPTCQEEYSYLPNQYKCFCGKVRNPVWNNYDTPHSCGEVCGNKRQDNCTHPCNELCHPGPCPPCKAFTSKFCSCGRSYQKVKCAQQMNVHCAQICDKMKNCSRHTCSIICHSGLCEPCDEVIIQECHCGENKREVICGSENSKTTNYSCEKVCDELLSCENHRCTQRCHSGSCLPCKTSPEIVKVCNCGKTPLENIKNVMERKSCTDIIPACDQICDKELPCGGVKGKSRLASYAATQRHRCQLKCHTGECLCQLESEVKCKCGNKQTSLSCSEAIQFTESNPFKCEKKCAKKRECGKHKCGQACCVAQSHPCLQICSKRLTCGIHKCTELCHIGKCPTCFNVSFDELRCRCGVAVIYPPIPCGASPPSCTELCNRIHTCEHEVNHYCHSEEACPPCVVLTAKICMGKHEERNNIPCYIKDISCGKLCEKSLSCEDHKCPKTCHKGDCGEEKCHQPCTKHRPSCGHPCASECHSGSECPPTDCQSRVLLQCQCGLRKERVLCYMKNKRLTTAALTLKMKELNCSINIAEMMSGMEKKQLECDEACAQVERNRRMAAALDIIDPDLLAEISGPQYSDFLKKTARLDPSFISEIERALSELVQTAQQSKHIMRSHVFKPMKAIQRKAIHELAEFYGCGTVSYDEEPHRNVVAMAHRGKSTLPPQTLTSLVQSEKHPRPPVPIPINANMEQLRMKSQKDLRSTDLKPEENKIDYFEMT